MSVMLGGERDKERGSSTGIGLDLDLMLEDNLRFLIIYYKEAVEFFDEDFLLLPSNASISAMLTSRTPLTALEMKPTFRGSHKYSENTRATYAKTLVLCCSSSRTVQQQAFHKSSTLTYLLSYQKMEWFIQAHGIVEDIPNYNCTYSNRKSGYVNYYIATSFLIYGIVTEIVYSIVMVVMLQKQQRHLSCYKIMIALDIGEHLHPFAVLSYIPPSFIPLAAHPNQFIMHSNVDEQRASVFDMAAISLNTLLTGYFFIVGANYCYTPTLTFITGTIALGELVLNVIKRVI
ncbi:hypothetical protein DICVIV_06619 [Dictyocaulus viviparus]|uniref:G protein-coupled receptor n=1 Tax=Dictyocaulus viviparus TaxID=29172 RepID=A0A0D8XRN7_DICVI|nr:hypothetical protein DICVIV_06619 [Dictyocaulus viviparus]